jgi:mono/diheme cytochrome c family protein
LTTGQSLAAAGLFFLALAGTAAFAQPKPAAQGDAKRGEYLAAAGGCLGCHTDTAKDAVPFAGGRALKTPFGTFYGPNLTPHPQAGLGGWSEADFIRAMREGRRPDGANYYPAFPYPSFTRIVDADLRDLWAYLRSLPPQARPSREHELGFFFRWRILLWPWKWLFFTAGPFQPDAKAPAAVNRGAYLVQALGHCGECHTPRNFLGGAKQSRFLAGAKLGEKASAPNLTPTRLKKMGDKELAGFLQTGLTEDGDVVGESMGEVITNTTSKLTAPDLAAMIAYLRALAPLPDEPK